MKNLQIIAFFAVLSILSYFLLAELSIRDYLTLILALLSIQMLLNYLLESYLISKLKERYFHMIIAPGTIIHEASHALAAKILGCEITKMSFFTGAKQGVLGFVEYTQPDDRVKGIRSLLIGFAPFFGCGLFLIAILNYLALENSGMNSITPGIVAVGSISEITETALFIFRRFYEQLVYLDLTNVAILVILYLEFSFAIGSAPSTQDLAGAFDSILDYPLEAVSMLMLLVSLLLIIEYGPGLDPQFTQLSESADLAVRWVILILLISTLMLLVSVPLSLLFVETAEIEGAMKAVPPLVFIVTYFVASRYMHTEVPISLGASFGMYLLSLAMLNHPEYFLKEDGRKTLRY